MSFIRKIAFPVGVIQFILLHVSIAHPNQTSEAQVLNSGSNFGEFVTMEMEESTILPPSTSSITILKNATDTAENFIPHGARNLEDLLGGWEAPYEIRKNYPIYLSGFDDEKRPIWIAELGKFDMRKLVEGGKERMESFDDYVRQLIQIMLKTIRMKSTDEEPVDRGMFIVDFDAMRLIQLAHIPTIRYCLGLMREYRHLIEDHMAKVYIVNANFVAESGLNLARPILGHMFDRFEVYGTNRAKWLPALLQAFPKDQLPEWYGGKIGHKPLLIYG